MKPVTSISPQAIQDLWGEGFSVVPRPRDSFETPAPPPGMAYQWCDTAARVRAPDWVPVPAERHPGMLAPYGATGEVINGGLILCERSAAAVEAFHQKVSAKAQRNVADWFERQAAQGIVGMVSVGDASGITQTEIGDNRVSETKIPDDMIPYYARLLRERDKVIAEYQRHTPEINIQDAAFRAQCMQTAIVYLRAKISQENDNAPRDSASSSADAGNADAGGAGGAGEQLDAEVESPRGA